MWLAGILGLAVGSFLNVLIDRLPKGQSVVWGRSRCDFCKKTLRWYELIPIVSFVMQKGRCRRCRKKISWQYPIVEVVTAVGFVLLLQGQAFDAHQGLALGGAWLIFSSLLVMFVADLKYQIIPDSMIIVGIIGVLGVIGILWENILTGAGAAAFFLLLYFITRGRGMGLGDVKLAFLLGLLLGYPGIIVGLYAAFLTGAGVGVILMIAKRKTWKSRVAFGPFLILGAVITLVWKTQILAWWGNFL
ncbi:MAG: prepilin peptidase [Patescibacteria group bacterium]